MMRFLPLRPTILILILNVVAFRQANGGASSTPKNLVTIDQSPDDGVNLTATAASSNQFQNEYQYRQAASKPTPIQIDRQKSSTSMPSTSSSPTSHSDHLSLNDGSNSDSVDYFTFPDSRSLNNVPNCRGRMRLNGTRGVISDGIGNYPTNWQCNWLIDTGLDNATIIFRFHEFSTECNYDTLSIYAGDSVYSKLVATFSGNLRDFRDDLSYVQYSHTISDFSSNKTSQNQSDAAPIIPMGGIRSTTELPPFEIRVVSGKALVVFNSDSAQSMLGFHITYSVNSCPLDCSNRGECDYETLKCKCHASYGDGCQFSEPIKKICDGNSQENCKSNSDQQSWVILRDTEDISVPVRAFHQSVVVNDHMWVFGGRSNESANTNLGNHRNIQTPIILAYDLKKRRWRNDILAIRGTTGLDHLAELSGHSVAAHGHKVFIYGGLAMNNSILNTLTVFDTNTLTFNEIPTEKTSKYSDEELVAPVSTTGHSANIIDGHMYVFLGYNPKFSYLNFAQKFNIGNNSWSIIKRRGSYVGATIGHTSTFDPVARLVYIFGGHIHRQVSTLYSFDPQSETWTFLEPSPSPRYFHSAIILNSQLLILGQSSYSHIFKSDECFQATHLTYDLSCSPLPGEGNKTGSRISCARGCWTMIPEEQTDLNLLKRHGQTLVSYDSNELLMFGGYNGRFLNDLWSFKIPSCSSFDSKQGCERPKLAPKCDWNSLNSSCETQERVFSHETTNPDQGCSKIDSTSLEIACQDRDTCSECLSTSFGCRWCSPSSTCHYNRCPALDDRAIRDYDSCVRRDELVVGPVTNETTSSELIETNTTSHEDFSIEPGNMIDCKVFNCYLCQMQPQCNWQNDDRCTYNPSLISSLTSSPMTPREELIDTQDSKSSGGQSNGPARRTASILQNLETYHRRYMHLVTDNMLGSMPCEKPCFMRRSCSECTSIRCIWLSSSEQCIESSAYFAYGSHLVGPYVAAPVKCPQASCSDIETCDVCLSNPRCGWLNDQSQTGLGKCLDGTSTGPLTNTNTNLFELNITKNEAPLSNWFYTSCPQCQCNGHSFCFSKTSVCANCLDHTEGSQCSRCTAGFYGNPVNGGTCKPCRCSGRASSCKSDTGRCNCNVKGMMGHNCDLCDKANSYVGMPSENNATCYYNLTTDYQYTFNMSKPEDHFYNEINFINVPIRKDSDVDFSIACSRLALVDVMIGHWDQNVPRKHIHSRIECGSFRLRYAHDQIKANQSFFVHIYNFQTPIVLQIAFSQGHRIFLPQFFFTFSSCFLFLFALFGVAWKVKHEFDLYVRNQRRFIEMEQMASRPLSTILLESIRKVSGSGPSNQVEPSPIAYEPLLENNVGVLSVFVQLPGRPSLAIASALVTLNDDTNGSQGDDGLGKRPASKDN